MDAVTRYEPMTPTTARDLLGLIGISISLREARSWTHVMRKQAADWAYAIYMKENDMPVPIPARPGFLDKFIRGSK